MTIIKFEFSQAELESRVQVALSNYEFHTPKYGRLTALELFQSNSVAHALELYHEKRKAGYTQSEVSPLYFDHNPGTGSFSWIEFHLYKPEKQQAKDKAAIAEKVEADYRAELEQLFNEHVEIEARRSVERRQRELEAARIAEEQRQLEEARQEIINLYKGQAA
ncbi:hypothetical protein [Pseudomonas sp. BN411]|uniref:hypothetical protein n=1 Tax=Pseudomonas sp. BN411 TaxID=2567887 RepID=UPI00245492AA|nr:hypothetical protein [Pseudomonas sp. BN411]MDH4562153.1 hypothetical protein [Pseudomonas sp. BN411]